ncbi:MAG: hypothetical protein WBP65_14130 [Candidatus Sulfotelmatobacter sp.]|jgi:hypothetical protein
MRILNILSGLAVLFSTLAFAHLLHHYYINAGEAAHSPPFLAGMASADHLAHVGRRNALSQPLADPEVPTSSW